MRCGVGCRHDSDPTFLWLWHRPEATALIWPLVWEPPYAMRAALGKAKRQKKKKKKKDSVLLWLQKNKMYVLNQHVHGNFIFWQFNFWQSGYEWSSLPLHFLSREKCIPALLYELYVKPHIRILNNFRNYFLSHLCLALLYSLFRSHIELQFIYCCILSALKLHNRIISLGI